MINLNQFIADHVINRQRSMFAEDIEANKETLRAEIENKSVCVVGGAGSIGSSFIKAVLPFRPSKLIVIDLNENGLAELTRDLRSTYGMYVPEEYRTYTLNFADPIFERIFREEKGFDIFANFSAHKHVRSEKDKYSVQALIENNVIKAKKLLDLLSEYPPRHFFCVSTDKAANPVNNPTKRLSISTNVRSLMCCSRQTSTRINQSLLSIFSFFSIIAHYIPRPPNTVRMVYIIIFKSTNSDIFSRYIISYCSRCIISSILRAYPYFTIPHDVMPGRI